MRIFFQFLVLGVLFCSTLSFADPIPAVVAPTAPVPAPITAATPTPPPAAPITTATVAVADQSPASLQLGLQAAFSEVMVKMSGNPSVMTIPAVQTVASNLTQWVQSYSYVQQAGMAPPAKPTWMLSVVFDQAGLKQLLQTITQSSQKDSTPPPAPSEIKLLVTGVKDMNDYTTLMQTLREQNGVTSVLVTSIDPDRISLTMAITENVVQLSAALSSDHHFKPLLANTDKKANAATLYYLWVGDQT